MRHLHDIYVMRSCIKHVEDFKARVLENFITKDKHRVAEDLSFETTLLKTTELLKTDKNIKRATSALSVQCPTLTTLILQHLIKHCPIMKN